MNWGLAILLIATIPALLRRSGLFSLLWILGSAALAYNYSQLLFGGITQDYILSLPSYGQAINIGLTPLSAFFGLLFSLGLPLGILYGKFYLQQHQAKGLASHLFWLGLMGLSMHGILWVRHSLLFLLLWELMSLSSFFCVIQDRSSSLQAGLKYLITMQIGAAFLIAGFGLAYLQTGSFDMLNLAGMNRIPLYLLLIGFAFKAGFFPFYSWLPLAHPVAPSHVSGIMSGLMIKTGLFGIMLILSCNVFSIVEIAIFTVIAMLSAFLGVTHCLAESNLKRALAYSSIENMGIIGLGLCLGLLGSALGNPQMQVLGYAGALLHALFHSLFKPLLFYLSGNILCATGSLKIDELGGLSSRMPRTANLFLIGVLAISALPVGNGFISEFSIYYAAVSGLNSNNLVALIASIVLLAMMAFIGALALIAFTKLYSIVFQGLPRSAKASKAAELPFGMQVTPLVLCSLIILTGVFGNLGLWVVKPLLSWYGLNIGVTASLQGIYTHLSIVFGILIMLFGLLWFIRKSCVKTQTQPTWGCAYQNPNSRMQYSSIAYIQPLEYFLKPFMLLLHQHSSDKRAYPDTVNYHEEVQDFLLCWLIEPGNKLWAKFLRLFGGMHNGKTSTYIAYSLAFLVLLLFWVLGVAK